MFSRPTLAELITRTRADTISRLSADELLRRSDPEVLSRVLAGASHEMHGFIEWIAAQVIYDTASVEYVDRWSAIWGITRVPASKAVGNIQAEGLAGSVIPAGTRMKSSTEIEYLTTADATLPAVAPIEAVTGGAAGNALAGAALSFTSPIAGVSSACVVATGGLVGGADTESDASLRQRLIARIQAPPHGGAAHDYKAWALQVAGVTRAWVAPLQAGEGTVTVRFVRDNDASLIPDAAEVQAVQDYIDGVRPVTARCYVVAPTAVPLNFTIEVNPATVAVKTMVEAELRALLLREAEPGGVILISHIREAISIATGEYDHELVAPTADVPHGVNEIATFGAITWA